MTIHPAGACKICRTRHASQLACPPATTRTEQHARRVRMELLATRAKRPPDHTVERARQHADTPLPKETGA